MINVIVTYTVPKEFVDKNLVNIQTFLKDFNFLDQNQFRYQVLQTEDKNTFVHISKYDNKEIQNELLNIPSFLKFQKERDESCDDIQQKIEVLEFVRSSGSL